MPRQVPHPLAMTHTLKVPCPKWRKIPPAIMCALLTEGLSALRCSAQEPWRDDRTVTCGSKALGTVAGPDRLLLLRAFTWYICRSTLFDSPSTEGSCSFTVEALFSRSKSTSPWTPCTQNGDGEVFRPQWAWAQCPPVCKDCGHSVRYLACLSSSNRSIQHFPSTPSLSLSRP